MYNESRKQDFISEYSRRSAVAAKLTDIFEAIAPFESLASKDIAQMDAEAVKTVYVAVEPQFSEDGPQFFAYLHEYMRWCSRSGFADSSARAFSFQPESIQEVRRNMVGSPKDMLRILNIVFTDIENNQIQYVYRMFFWMAFMGLSDDEAVKVRMCHVDLRRMQIVMDGETQHRTYEIYKESTDDLYQCMNLDVMTETKRNTSMVMRAPGDVVLRLKANNKPVDQALRSTIRPLLSKHLAAAVSDLEAAGGSGAGITLNRVKRSGVFYRTYQDECLGVTPNFSKYAREEYMKDGNRTTNAQSRAKSLFARRVSLEKDYAAWKAAFIV